MGHNICFEQKAEILFNSYFHSLSYLYHGIIKCIMPHTFYSALYQHDGHAFSHGNRFRKYIKIKVISLYALLLIANKALGIFAKLQHSRSVSVFFMYFCMIYLIIL